MGLVELGKELLGPNPGATLLLFFLCGVLAWAYWKEKKKNEEVAKERLKEAREDVELYMSTLNEATNAVREFKSTNDALRIGFETLARTVSRQKGD